MMMAMMPVWEQPRTAWRQRMSGNSRVCCTLTRLVVTFTAGKSCNARLMSEWPVHTRASQCSFSSKIKQ